MAGNLSPGSCTSTVIIFIKISPEQSEDFLLSGVDNSQVVLTIALFGMNRF